MWLISSLYGIIQILRSNDHPWQLALGIALGTMLGLIPAKSLFSLVVLIALYLLNVNMGLALLTAALYKIFGAFLSPLFHIVGHFFLVDVTSLTSFWTALYNLPIIPWTRFYNTVVLGSMVVSLVLLFPHYLVAYKALRYYQTTLREKLETHLSKSKWYKAMTHSMTFKKWADRYSKYESIKKKISG